MINLLDPSNVITRMFDAKRYDDMYNYCKGMLEKDPEEMIALQNISLALIHMEQYPEAIQYCDKVLTMKNFDMYAQKNKIYALECLSEYDKVIEICQKIISDRPDMVDTWLLNTMGISFNKLDRHREALECYERSLKLDQNDATALMNKAISLSHLGRYNQAVEYYDMAQRLDFEASDIPLAKSKLYEKIGLADEAFLAAQGVLNQDMKRIILDAKKNKCTVFHQFCEEEFAKIDSARSGQQ